MQEVELEYRLAQEETSMVTLQQQQAGVLAQLEVALVDHQAVALRVRIYQIKGRVYIKYLLLRLKV